MIRNQKFIILILAFITNSGLLFSQNKNMSNTYKKTRELGKDSIIQMAYSIVDKKFPAIKVIPSDFEITAWANKSTILVKFRRLIRYIPDGKEEGDFIYDFSVDVINNEISPFDSWGADTFYVPSELDTENIEFVIKAFNLPVDGFINSVYENPDKYVIDLNNEVAFGRYYIDKVTGKEAENSFQGSYVPKPAPDFPGEIDKDPLIELKK